MKERLDLDGFMSNPVGIREPALLISDKDTPSDSNIIVKAAYLLSKVVGLGPAVDRVYSPEDGKYVSLKRAERETIEEAKQSLN